MEKLKERVTLYLDRMQDYFAQLSVRDQRILMVFLPFLVTLIVYFLIWNPVVSWSGKQRADYLYEKETYALMLEKQDQARAVVSASKQSGPTKDAAAVIASSGKRIGLNLTRIQPARQGVSVWIDEAAYQKLWAWLSLLNEQEHMHIREIHLSRTERTGVVKVFMRLSY